MGAGRLAAGSGLRLIVAAGCVLLLAGLGTAASAAGSVSPDGPAAAPGAQLWASRYSGPAGTYSNNASAVVISPGGNMVYVTGTTTSTRSQPGPDYVTIAYSAGTGARRWLSRYNGPASGRDESDAIAVSPDGATVYVTGYSTKHSSGLDYVTIAYNAATGARRWLSRYNDPVNGDDIARTVVVSPDGSTIYVTGQATAATSAFGYATVAYNAATGAQLWAATYSRPAGGYDAAASLAVSPDGGAVYVTGDSGASPESFRYVTVAYNAGTGTQLWAASYADPSGRNRVAEVAASPDGGTVFVTGISYQGTSGTDFATVAYNAATGTRLWARRYSGPGSTPSGGAALAVSPHGDAVYVTGYSRGDASPGYMYATVAYRAATGAQLWASRYKAPRSSGATSVAVSPDGSIVYITGITGTTIAYRAATGTRLWARRYRGQAGSSNDATSLAVGPDGREVLVTGDNYRSSTPQETWATIAYHGQP